MAHFRRPVSNTRGGGPFVSMRGQRSGIITGPGIRPSGWSRYRSPLAQMGSHFPYPIPMPLPVAGEGGCFVGQVRPSSREIGIPDRRLLDPRKLRNRSPTLGPKIDKGFEGGHMIRILSHDLPLPFNPGVGFEATGPPAHPDPDPRPMEALPLQKLPVGQRPGKAEGAGAPPAGHAVNGISDGLHPGPLARMDLAQASRCRRRPYDVVEQCVLWLAPNPVLGPEEGLLSAKEKHPARGSDPEQPPCAGESRPNQIRNPLKRVPTRGHVRSPPAQCCADAVLYR